MDKSLGKVVRPKFSLEDSMEAFKSTYKSNREGKAETITVKGFIKNLNKIKK